MVMRFTVRRVYRPAPIGFKLRPTRRARPGVVALLTVHRLSRGVINELADPDYVAPSRRRVNQPAVVFPRPATRFEGMAFVRAAKELVPLAENHLANDEWVPYQQFRGAVLAAGARDVRLRDHHVIMSDVGSWYDQIIRFNRNGQKLEAIRNGGMAVNFWRHSNTTLSVAIKEIQLYMSNFSQPISMLLGQENPVTGEGHAVVVIIYRKSIEEMLTEDWQPVKNSQTNRDWGMILKDSLPLVDAGVSSMARSLARGLNIRKIRVVGEMEREMEVIDTCCLKESYVVAASVLQGQYPDELLRVRPRFYKNYDTVGNSYQYFPYGA